MSRKSGLKYAIIIIYFNFLFIYSKKIEGNLILILSKKESFYSTLNQFKILKNKICIKENLKKIYKIGT